MSWLNLNESFNSLKGQITNFASDVLSEVPSQEIVDNASLSDTQVSELEDKCRTQELEIASLKKLTENLQALLQSERLSRQNGVKEDEGSWYWDPPPQTSKLDPKLEIQYQVQIRALQDELSNLKQRDTIDLGPDTEEELNRLREENQNLSANMEALDSQHQAAMDKLLSLKKELQQNFEVLKQDHEELKSSNDEYADEVKTLLEKIGEKDNEIENMKTVKSDYDTLHHKYQNLERIYGLLRENAEKFQEENQELHEEVFNLQEQVTKLDHDLEIATKNAEITDTVPKESYDEVLKQLNDMKDRRNANLMHSDEINIDDNAKSIIESLKRDINELRHQLSQKDGEFQENTDHKTIKAEKVMQLYNKYVNFEIPLDYVGEIPSVGDNLVIYKLESVFKTVNSFKKEIDYLEHKLSEKNLNVNHLQTQIDDLTTENDFLTTDIQHFEQELNEMKKNNDFLISEIAALKNSSKLEPIIETTHEDNLAKLETELADSNKMNKSFESEIKRIEKELAEVRTEKIALQESLADLKTKYTTMLSELDICKNKTQAVEELEKSAHDQELEKLNKTQDVIDDLKKRLNAADSKNEQMSIDIHILENDKVLLTKQVDDLKNSVNEKISSYRELEALKLAMDSKLQDAESKLDDISKENNDLETEKLYMVEKVGALESQLLSANNTTEVERITAENNQLSQKINQVVKENSTLVAQIASLQSREEDLVIQNNNLKTNSKGEAGDTENSAKEAKEACVVKLVQQQDLHKEITSLKQENHKLNERNKELENDLSSTDGKILHLDEEFNKLTADINEKDELIDELNATIYDNKLTILNLNNSVTELNQSIQIKNEELERLRLKIESLSSQVASMSESFNKSENELLIVRNSAHEIETELDKLRTEMTVKNTEITALTTQLEGIRKAHDEYKTLANDKEKEIKELIQLITELKEKTKSVAHENIDFGKREIIEKEVTKLKSDLTQKESEMEELKSKCEQFEKDALDYTSVIDKATAEKTELINLVNLKHNESIQYHNEIQRLNHILLEQTNEFKRIIEEKDRLIQHYSDSCSNCERLRITLKEKDEIIIALNQNTTEYEKLKTELTNAGEVVRSLTEKCDNLDRSLAIQLEAVKKLKAENAQLSEQEQNSTRELERLRRHLVETEESYTQELMASEQKLTECQTRLHQVEDRAKQTSTVYTSNSIRANQEVETLRNQIKLLEKQREDVQAKLSEADDARSRSEAALTNLQIVLEQFQLDKDREIHSATEKIRNKMEDLKRQNSGLQVEISRLNTKLEESLVGLQAATRLGDQVETKTAQINDLKEQVRTLQTSVAAAEERYYNAISNQQDKVDKNLVKNLVINYVMTAAASSSNKTQVLRILSTVLDFNQQECERLGLARSPNTQDSLAAEFVKFLQNESTPRAPLPNMMTLGQSRSATPSSRKSSTAGPPPFDPTHKRNPSTGSNNLLLTNLDNVETSSQVSHVSRDSIELRPTLDTGVNQMRNNEGAILKHVLRDM